MDDFGQNVSRCTTLGSQVERYLTSHAEYEEQINSKIQTITLNENDGKLFF